MKLKQYMCQYLLNCSNKLVLLKETFFICHGILTTGPRGFTTAFKEDGVLRRDRARSMRRCKILISLCRATWQRREQNAHHSCPLACNNNKHFEARNSTKYYLRIEPVPQRQHITSRLKRSTGYVCC
jgi:hypothetical protein